MCTMIRLELAVDLGLLLYSTFLLYNVFGSVCIVFVIKHGGRVETGVTG
jgi:hypothetical protein